MAKKYILVIDDSALMRRVVSDIINSDGRFEVKDLAVNGLEGLDLVVKNNVLYSAIILDINMPKMNGLEFLEQLFKINIKIPVIVVSTVAKEGAKETIRALELGAYDFVTKPDSFIEAKSDMFRIQIIHCLEVSIGLVPVTMDQGLDKTEKREEKEALKPVQIKKTPSKREHGRISRGKKLVALACSTGGPKALQSVIPYLPADLGASVLIVQHMPEGFTYSLTQRLNELSAVRVKEAEDKEGIDTGCVYMAKGGCQMRLVQKTQGVSSLVLSKDPPRNGLRPCADIMYESLLDTDYDEIICVVLTGMGGDGTKGIMKLSGVKNVYVIAQDEETSTVYGMPKVIAESGLADEVLPLKLIADAITKAVGVTGIEKG